MSEKREYRILNTDYFAIRDSGRQTIYDCDGDTVTDVPYEWNEHELDIWGKAYEAGLERGEHFGESSGEYRIQRDMQEALGIYNRLNEIEDDIKLLASVLYYHDGICKEDVASMAGK